MQCEKTDQGWILGPLTRTQQKTLTAFCRQMLGRSHGAHSGWCIMHSRVQVPNDRFSRHRALLVKDQNVALQLMLMLT